MVWGERLAAALILNIFFYPSLSLSTSLVAFSGIRISGLWPATLTSTNWFATKDVLDTAADSTGLCKVDKHNTAANYSNGTTDFVGSTNRKFHPRGGAWLPPLPSAVGSRPLFGKASALEPMLGLISQGYPTVLFSLHVNKHNPFVGPVLHTISHCLYGKHILLKVRNRWCQQFEQSM